MLHSNPYITTNDIAEYLTISRRMVQKIIKKLKDEGIVKRVDGDRGGHWEIINK